MYNINNNTFDFVQNNPSASIGVVESAIYLQDKFSWSNQFDISFGLRLDAQFLVDEIPVSEEITKDPAFEGFDNDINNNFQVNSRFGFNYRIPSADLTLRGGSGLFSGRLGN